MLTMLLEKKNERKMALQNSQMVNIFVKCRKENGILKY